MRTWHDPQGNVLAEGRLTNIKRGSLLVLDANNQIVRIPFNDLCDDDLCFLTAWWRVPTECTFGDELYAGRNWAPSTLTWKASALCHKPLFFEEVQLERYGHTAGPLKQPFLSGAHFFRAWSRSPTRRASTHRGNASTRWVTIDPAAVLLGWYRRYR